MGYIPLCIVLAQVHVDGVYKNELITAFLIRSAKSFDSRDFSAITNKPSLRKRFMCEIVSLLSPRSASQVRL